MHLKLIFPTTHGSLESSRWLWQPAKPSRNTGFPGQDTEHKACAPGRGLAFSEGRWTVLPGTHFFPGLMFKVCASRTLKQYLGDLISSKWTTHEMKAFTISGTLGNMLPCYNLLLCFTGFFFLKQMVLHFRILKESGRNLQAELNNDYLASFPINAVRLTLIILPQDRIEAKIVNSKIHFCFKNWLLLSIHKFLSIHWY